MTKPLCVVLVTKGRKAYLQEMLSSLDRQDLEDTGVLVIDNGSQDGSQDVINRWKSRTTAESMVLRWPVNRHDGLDAIAQIASTEFGSGWLTFPGDDDLMRPGHVGLLRETILNHPQATLVGSGARFINAAGGPTGDGWPGNLPPSAPWAWAVGRLMNRPLFAWPALAFKSSVLPCGAPGLRYCLDWWVQVHCALSGTVASTNEDTLLYRQHPGQESFTASDARKRYEGAWMLNLVLSSSRVRERLAQLTRDEAQALGESLLAAGGPLYGDRILGGAVMMPLIATLSMESRTAESIVALEAQLQTQLGLVSDPSLSRAWLGDGPPADRSVLPVAGLRVLVPKGHCSRVTRILEEGRLQKGRSAEIAVLCMHNSDKAPSNASMVILDCRSSAGDNTLGESLRWSVIARIEEAHPTAIGLAPGELIAVRMYNRLRGLVPSSVRPLARRLAGRK